MIQAQPRTYSKYNVLARATQPMAVDHGVLSQLASLSMQNQWILFTAECPRPHYDQLAAVDICCNKIIQMKPSHALSEFEIVVKAIRSGNASAIVASTAISTVDQALLVDLGSQYQCQVFFVEGRATQYH
ncbi:SulA-like leucine-rich domain-containing protein [Vibrio sp.]|uniref:SulA-like leucine-rich domain-containing protein n=1 Tax=Vibrio sp. TaxID=678 RepID=UPI003D11558F